MSTRNILTRSVATLLALTPVLARGAADTLSGAAPAWGTATNWSLLAIPGTGDNAIIAATGIVDVRGSTLGGLKEIQDITFSSTAAVSLTNNSSSTPMVLALNGGRGAGVPLISTVGDFAYTITGPGTNAIPQPLALQLRASGAISVAANVLTISSIIGEFGGARSLSKTGAGRLTLSAANTFTGGMTVSAGILEVTNNGALGIGPTVINGGTLEINLASATLTVTDIELNAGGQLATRGTVTLNNNVTVNGGTLATRSSDGGTYAGLMNVIAPSFVNLRSYTTVANSQSINITGLLTGSGSLTINGNDPQTNGGGKALILTNVGNTYSGTFNVSNNQILRSAPAATGNTLGTGAVNLSGGTLQLRDNGTGNGGTLAYGNNVVVSAGGGTIDVDRVGANLANVFQLGTLSIGAQTLNSTGANSYFTRFAGATTLTGAAVFNPTSAPLVLGGAVGGGFALTKTGGGILQMNAANSYTGATQIDAGTLVLNGSIATSPVINVKAGATLDVTAAAGGFTVGAAQTLSGDGALTGVATVGSGGVIRPGDGTGAGTLTFAALAFGTAAGHTATVSLTNAVTPGMINVTGANALTASGGANTVSINLPGTAPAVGTYTLIDYSGAIGGTGFTAFKLGTMPNRLVANLVDNAANTSIDLSVTGTDFPLWKGAQSSEWSTAAIAPAKNWVLNSNNASGTDFLVSDNVVFSDVATSTAVNVSVADVAPASMLFSNVTKDYVVSGSKAIAGVTGLTVNGGGKVTVSNTNSFTGAVVLTAGTLSVASVANGGVASPLGVGTGLTFGGGTLEFTGASGSTDRAVTLNGGGGTVKTATALTLAGAIGGVGTLTKTGNGTLTLTGTNAYGGTTVSAGILQIGDGVTNGSLGTGAVTDDATLAFNNAAALTITNQILGAGAVTKTGAGNLVLSGSLPNSYSGTTTVSAGNLILSKSSGTNAIGGDLIVAAGGTVSYGTTAGQLQDHIVDSANVTINGGTFGGGASDTQAIPTAGVTDIVASVTVNSGTFLSGRNATVGPFTVAGLFKVAGGTALVQRGGAVTANAVQFTGGALSLDGGSTTATNESKLNVGPGGLTLAGTTISFNAGPSTVAAGSQGSLVNLNGNVTSTGTASFVRQNPTLSSARVDLGGGTRTFTVTGTLTIGTAAAAIAITNGALTKSGAGTLVLAGANTYAAGTVIDGGALSIDGDAALGGAAGGVTIDGNAILRAAAAVSSARAFTLTGTGGQIDTNGQSVTLTAGGSVAGTTLTKTGLGTLTLAGMQTYTTLNANGGVTNVNSALGTGGSTLNAHSTVNIAVSQTLAALNFADGAEVTFGTGLPFAGEPEKFGAPALVPEPGSLGLLMLGALGVLSRRRRIGD